jgi:hypothetical protein
MNVWFLTLVQDGHVSLMSIMADSQKDAEVQTYAEFKRALGHDSAWAMSEVHRRNVNGTINSWELENVAGSWIKATLIKA